MTTTEPGDELRRVKAQIMRTFDVPPWAVLHEEVPTPGRFGRLVSRTKLGRRWQTWRYERWGTSE